MKRIVDRWSILIRERFQPQVYVPMIFVFTATNGLYMSIAESRVWEWSRFGLMFAMILSFFLRMRVFDEIKDYEVDLAINPHRPLARGVASHRQVKRGLFVFIVFELILAWSLGLWPFLIHVGAMFYSLMMFEEFFLSDHLRPHLTTYAVTHTFVSALLGLSAAVALTNVDLRALRVEQVYFFLMNWAFFNLFEFARKTFSEDEERENVESYSKIFGLAGAVLLSVSQGALGNWLLWKSLSTSMLAGRASHMLLPLGGLAVYAVATLPFVLRRTHLTAQIFRAASSFYLLAHYLLTLALLLWK